MKKITREQMKQLEAVTTNQFYIPTGILMENAGRMSAQAAIKYLKDLGKDPKESKIIIACGTGNNGGDGAVAARHLHNMGLQVEVILIRDIYGLFQDGKSKDDELSDHSLGEVGLNLKILKAFEVTVKLVNQSGPMPVLFKGADLIVDAMLGSGLDTMTSGIIKPPIKELIETINDLEIPVMSLDLPSGLDCNTGALAGTAIHADRTITFALPKVGLYKSMGPSVAGEISTVDISIPRKLMRQIKEVTSEDE